MRTVFGTSKRFVGLLAGMAICGGLTAPVKAAEKDKAPATKAKAAPAAHEKTGAGIHVPIEYRKLDNGLKVVLSPRHDLAHGGRRRLLQHRVPHRAEGPHRASRTSSST